MDFEEIPYPVKLYRDRYKAEHARNTQEAFKELVRRSGVDTKANAGLAADIRKRKKEVESISSRLRKWRFLRTLLIFLMILCAGAVVLFVFQICGSPLIDRRLPDAAGIGCAVFLLLLLWLVLSPLKRKIALYKAQIDEKQKILDEKIRQAWDQMAPLNSLFRWDTITSIVMKSLPILRIDKYFTNARMENLRRHFHWAPPDGDTHSILCCQSGTMNGNPWLLAEDFHQFWGTETYSGSITISWRTQVTYTDSDGKTRTRWETRYQTLTATVEKPKPFYTKEKFLVYGNEAAPELNFSREPNSLSDRKGFFSRGRLRSAIRSLEKKSRDLDDPFTIMDNREFDACFHAVDRDNELQFRVLFSPLAQQEMLNLLRDREQGYGDDFRFCKRKMINTISSDHLSAFDFSGSPDRFRHYDFAEIRKIFQDYSCDFFRTFYFTLAPLLCIPLYQEYRNYQDIYNGIIDSGDASDFEYESFANAMDENHFRPADAVTPCILKTRTVGRENSAVRLSVSAYAFRGVPRVEHISKYGGDGRLHDIPVHWTEYLPVYRETPMAVCETGTSDLREFEQACRTGSEWRDLFTRWKAVPGSLLFRRNLAAFIPEE